MPPVRVVPGFNPGKDRQTCLSVRFPYPPVNQLTLQGGKETLGLSVVILFTHGSHRSAYAHFLAAVAKGNAGVLGLSNRSSQHWVIDWILDIHLTLRLVFFSQVFFGAWCLA